MIVSVVMASSYTSAPLVLQKDTQRPCPCPPTTRNITPWVGHSLAAELLHFHILQDRTTPSSLTAERSRMTCPGVFAPTFPPTFSPTFAPTFAPTFTPTSALTGGRDT